MTNLVRRIGLITALVGGLWLAFELTRQGQVPTEPPPGDAAAPEIVDLPDLAVEPPLLAEFKATLERPLFNQDRRPDEGAADADTGNDEPAAPGTLANLRLSAVIVDPEGRSALLQVAGNQQAQRVTEGGEIAGWRLEEVRDDAVVLTSGGRRTELPLRTFEPPRPVPVRPRNLPPRRPPATAVPRRRVPTPPPTAADDQAEAEPAEKAVRPDD